jgi:hypothetical protein
VAVLEMTSLSQPSGDPPKIIPNFRELKVPEGTGSLLVMDIVPSSVLNTTTSDE